MNSLARSRAQRARQGLTVAALALFGLLWSADAALAHGIVGVQDLPIPRWLFGWAATVVLVVSFVALAVLWRTPQLQDGAERNVVRLPAPLAVVPGLLGVVAFGAVVYAGFAGSDVPSANLAPTTIYVIVWVGLPSLALLVGDVWSAVNPWRAIGRATGWVASRVAGSSLPAPLPYPEKLGRWPAAVGLLAFGWVELVYSRGDEPIVLALLALVYCAVMLVGMSLYGVRPWTENADAFTVYFGLFAALAPVRWDGGRLFLRRPLSGVPGMAMPAGMVTLLLAAIAITTFDGLAEGPLWSDVAPSLADAIASLGFAQGTAVSITFTLGLGGVVALIAGLFWLGVEGMRSVRPSDDRATLARTFGHTLVPIAVAYMVAHYFSLLAYQGQAIGFLISNPLGNPLAPGDGGLFGTGQWTVDYSWVGANAIWYVQVGALVVGHIWGLVLAHDRAIAFYGDARDATRSQYWMLTVMVAFTSLGLWLLSAANS